jgi:precorrin-6Y C5,15-methyltransferase (decarboxylating)
MPEGAEGWALPEAQFDSRDAVLTKAEVRALALARLGPGPGALVWDVGAGSGSVGIECARFGAAVIAVERDELRCERVRANATRHGVDVRIVPGEAPQALAELPDPDAVFVGGGGPNVIEAVAARRPARIVVALAAVERAGPATAALAAAGYATDGALVQASRFTPLPGDVHRLAAANPVFLVWGTAAPGTTEPVGPAGPQLHGPGATEPVSAGDHGGPGNRGTGPGAP